MGPSVASFHASCPWRGRCPCARCVCRESSWIMRPACSATRARPVGTGAARVDGRGSAEDDGSVGRSATTVADLRRAARVAARTTRTEIRTASGMKRALAAMRRGSARLAACGLRHAFRLERGLFDPDGVRRLPGHATRKPPDELEACGPRALGHFGLEDQAAEVYDEPRAIALVVHERSSDGKCTLFSCQVEFRRGLRTVRNQGLTSGRAVVEVGRISRFHTRCQLLLWTVLAGKTRTYWGMRRTSRSLAP